MSFGTSAIHCEVHFTCNIAVHSRGKILCIYEWLIGTVFSKVNYKVMYALVFCIVFAYKSHLRNKGAGKLWLSLIMMLAYQFQQFVQSFPAMFYSELDSLHKAT